MDEFDSSPSPCPSSIHTEAIAEFSDFLNKLNPILHDIRHSVDSSGSPPPPPLHSALHSFETDYNRAKSTIDSQTSPSPAAKQIQHLAQNLGRSLGLVLFAAHDLPIANKPGIEILCHELMNLKFDSSLGSPPSAWASEFDIDEEEEDDDDDDDDEEEEKEEEGTAGKITVENERVISTVDEAVTEIMHGGDEQRFNEAILVLNGFLNEGMMIDQVEEDFIKLLSNRLISSKGDERTIILQMLKHFSRNDNRYKVADVHAN